jgi:hypothetical protein
MLPRVFHLEATKCHSNLIPFQFLGGSEHKPNPPTALVPVRKYASTISQKENRPPT